jgi:2-desacetyl-2-hydroxyethyl bacteriochlorophyllide A dehydrogenase
MMMNVLVCEQPHRLVLSRAEIPSRGEDEVLIRVRRVGICGTDMHIVRGHQPFLSYPRVMGHELAGEVVEAPAGSPLSKDDAVYVMPYLSCDHCAPCRKGLTNCCQNIQVLGVHRDGALAEYLAVPQRFVCKAEGITLDEAAMAEFLSIGAHAVRRAVVKTGERALVVGAGPIGMAAALFAHADGAKVCVVDNRADRIAFCAQHLGADHALLVSDRLKDELLQFSGGDLFDVVFDATGNAQAMSAGFDYVAHGGRYVFLSIVSDRISFSDPDFHRREMTLMASRNATLADFDRVVRAMREGKVPTHALNTHRTRLDTVAEVLPIWMLPETGVIKGIVEC